MPRYLDREHEVADPGYQFELGTWSIVAMICVVAVLCGMFFALGYTFGKHAIPADFTLGNRIIPANAAQTALDKPSPSVNLPVNPAAAGASVAVTPGANSPVAHGTPAATPPNPAALSAAEQNRVPATLQPSAGGGGGAAASLPPVPALSGAQAPKPSASIPGDVAVTNKAPATIPGTANFAVQVFAGVNQSDAYNLAAALKARQYPVYVLRPDPSIGQQYYRVQVGPFPTRQQAQEMQSRLAADGYHAILKP
ncbi:MAG: SPOR domain-containing protein [Terriglobales bacterium]